MNYTDKSVSNSQEFTAKNPTDGKIQEFAEEKARMEVATWRLATVSISVLSVYTGDNSSLDCKTCKSEC